MLTIIGIKDESGSGFQGNDCCYACLCDASGFGVVEKDCFDGEYDWEACIGATGSCFYTEQSTKCIPGPPGWFNDGDTDYCVDGDDTVCTTPDGTDPIVVYLLDSGSSTCVLA